MPGKDLQNGQKHTSLSAHGRIVREHMFPDNIAMRPSRTRGKVEIVPYGFADGAVGVSPRDSSSQVAS